MGILIDILTIAAFAISILVLLSIFSDMSGDNPALPNRETIKIMCEEGQNITAECKSVVGGLFGETFNSSFCACFTNEPNIAILDCPCGVAGRVLSISKEARE